MQVLNLKSNHKPIREYYKTLQHHTQVYKTLQNSTQITKLYKTFQQVTKLHSTKLYQSLQN
jgi:hypothetical protein